MKNKKKMATTRQSYTKTANLPFGLDKLPRKTVRALLFIMAFATVGLWALLLTFAAAHDRPAEDKLHNLQNQHRSNIGKPAFFRSSCVTNAAREWAAYMADTGKFEHSSITGPVQKHCGRSNLSMGENIGSSGSSGAAAGQMQFDAYMGSPGHRANIEGDYNFVGVGAMNSADGLTYTAVIFVKCTDCGAPFTSPVTDPTPPPPPPSNPAPEADFYTNDDDNAAWACAYQSGWAIDRSDYNQSTDIHVYIDNEPPVLEVANKNNGADAGFQSRFGTSSERHGWAWTIPERLKNGVSHQIKFAVIDVPTKDQGNNFFGTRTIKCGAAAPPTDTRAPDTPGNFRVNGASSTALRVAWTASGDDVGVTGYDVSISGPGKNETRSLSSSATSATWTGLASSTRYSFSIVAKDASGKRSAAANTSYSTYPPPSSTTVRSIIGNESGLCVDVRNAANYVGNKVGLYYCRAMNDGYVNAQLWTFKQHSDGTYEIRSKLGNGENCLDVPNYNANDGVDLQLYTCNGVSAQRWVVSSDKICSAINQSKCFDAEGPSKNPGTIIQLWQYYGNPNQKWYTSIK